MRDRTVTPLLILKKLSAYRQQNSLEKALREVRRIERTLFTLRWFEDQALRRMVTAEPNKGEARNSSARAVAFTGLGGSVTMGGKNPQTRAAALNLDAAAIIFSTVAISVELSSKCAMGCPHRPSHAGSPVPSALGLTPDYVRAKNPEYDAEGFAPLNAKPLP